MQFVVTSFLSVVADDLLDFAFVFDKAGIKIKAKFNK